eukprot:1514526-Amphidinium_carterae.1
MSKGLSWLLRHGAVEEPMHMDVCTASKLGSCTLLLRRACKSLQMEESLCRSAADSVYGSIGLVALPCQLCGNLQPEH